jgi:hypothetical protein
VPFLSACADHFAVAKRRVSLSPAVDSRCAARVDKAWTTPDSLNGCPKRCPQQPRYATQKHYKIGDIDPIKNTLKTPLNAP